MRKISIEGQGLVWLDWKIEVRDFFGFRFYQPVHRPIKFEFVHTRGHYFPFRKQPRKKKAYFDQGQYNLFAQITPVQMLWNVRQEQFEFREKKKPTENEIG